MNILCIYSGEFKSFEEIDLRNPTHLACSDNNNLTELPENLPKSLQTLECRFNKLTKLPDDLPNTLKELNCSANKLIKLPNLPITLQILYCGGNQLKELPNLPSALESLDCSGNKLTELPENLPITLRYLNCSSNKLRKLPNNIIKLKNLRCFDYSNNEIEYIPPNITRFLNNVRNIDIGRNNMIYNDYQNIHNHMIQECIRTSIENIITEKPIIKNPISYILNSNISGRSKQLLMEYIGDNSVHSVLNLTFEEILKSVLSRIEINKDKDEILKVLYEEMNDSECKCFTGRISRLINSLNGFDESVNIRIGENEQISNIISLIREELRDNYSVERHKELVKKRLEEMNYEKGVIEEWILFIE